MTPQSFKDLLVDALAELGTSLETDLDVLAIYAAARTAQLAVSVGTPGFDLAVRAERDSVALEAGITAAQQADLTDQRILGIIQGALRVGAVAMAAVA